MNERDQRVNGWSQSSLLPPERLAVEVSIHLDAGKEVGQVGIRVRDAYTDTTLGMYVGNATGAQAVVELALELINAAISEHHHPF